MGFTTLLDIVGSTIIGGLLLLLLLRINNNAVDNNFVYGGELTVQENLVELVNLIEYDFRRIGYCEDYTVTAGMKNHFITYADTSRIYFVTDLAISSSSAVGDGNLDTLKYYLGSIDELSHTPNPKDRILYRVENNNPEIGANLGVTQFRINYYDAMGDSITTPVPQDRLSEISTMEINVTVENVASIGIIDEENGKTPYTADRSAFWRQIRLAAKNFMNR